MSLHFPLSNPAGLCILGQKKLHITCRFLSSSSITGLVGSSGNLKSYLVNVISIHGKIADTGAQQPTCWDKLNMALAKRNPAGMPNIQIIRSKENTYVGFQKAQAASLTVHGKKSSCLVIEERSTYGQKAGYRLGSKGKT